MIQVDTSTYHVLLQAGDQAIVQRVDELKQRRGWSPEYLVTLGRAGEQVVKPLSKLSPDAISKLPKAFCVHPSQTVRYFGERGWKPESSILIPYDDPR